MSVKSVGGTAYAFGMRSEYNLYVHDISRTAKVATVYP